MKYLCIFEISEGLLFNKDSNAISSDVEISCQGSNYKYDMDKAGVKVEIISLCIFTDL